MEKQDFYNQFKELCNYFHDKTYENKKITALYYKKCQNMSLEEFKKLCEELICNLKFMPKISDFDKIQGFSAIEKRIYTKEFLESLYDNI